VKILKKTFFIFIFFFERKFSNGKKCELFISGRDLLTIVFIYGHVEFQKK